MKRAAYIVFSLTIFIGLYAAVTHAADVRRKPMRATPSSFPAYKTRPGAGPRVQGVKDSLGNRVTEDHLNRVEFAQGREDKLMRRDPRTTEVVSVGRARFATVYRHEFEHKTVFIDTGLHHYNTIILEHPQVVGLWRTHGFYGGFYWGFHPILAIDTYFYNPLVYWFYVGAFNEYYYRNWYKTEYDAYPELHQAFGYPGLYYPTENLRQLLFGVSAMPVENQVHFRQAVSFFTSKLAQSLANHLSMRVTLTKGDIVVTHYEILGVDEGIVLEGFVTYNGASFDFKGLLDLRTPPNTEVFAPVALDVNPTPNQIHSLDEMNAQISTMKGEPVTAVPETPNVPDSEPAGQITADPQAK
jgi:hypothetical protein